VMGAKAAEVRRGVSAIWGRVVGMAWCNTAYT
jgi:hypothetical protein